MFYFVIFASVDSLSSSRGFFLSVLDPINYSLPAGCFGLLKRKRIILWTRCLIFSKSEVCWINIINGNLGNKLVLLQLETNVNMLSPLHHAPFSAKLMISEVSSSTSLLIACPSRLGISTLPSSRSFPAWSFRSAVTIAAFGSGCVMLGLSRICNLLRMCLLTASRKSTFSWPDSGSSGWARPQDAQVSRDAVCASSSVPGAAVQRIKRTQATKSASPKRQLFIFCLRRRERITFFLLSQSSNLLEKILSVPSCLHA